MCIVYFFILKIIITIIEILVPHVEIACYLW